MKPKELIVMLILSALWGASFLFIKISAPEFGAVLTANIRVFIAFLTLAIICFLNKTSLDFLRHWKSYMLIGALNAAIPFVLISTAELHIDASLASILNATTPSFTALVALFWNKEKISFSKFCGLLLGLIGVIVLVGINGIGKPAVYIYAPLSLLAALSYGLAGVYSSKTFKNLNPYNLAFGQQLSASILLLPISLFNLPSKSPSSKATICLVLLAVFCTAIAYLFYFYLVKKVGAVKSSTVTFLVHVFGTLWSFLFLKENITLQNLLGLAIIISSIFLINSKKIKPSIGI
jgi:drug/metabolite transporter (DMT)-like permease